MAGFTGFVEIKFPESSNAFVEAIAHASAGSVTSVDVNTMYGQSGAPFVPERTVFASETEMDEITGTEVGVDARRFRPNC